MSEQLPQYNYANVLPANREAAGFQITELDPAQRAAVPMDALLVNQDEATRIAKGYINAGGVLFTEEESKAIVRPIAGVIVSQSAVEERLGRVVDPMLLDNPFTVTPEAERLKTELEQAFMPETQQAVTEAVAATVAGQMERPEQRIPAEYARGLTTISQVFRIDNGRGGSFNIVNFSNTPLEGISLRKTLNSIREMDELTGGASTELTKLIAIIPQTCPEWEVGKGVVTDGEFVIGLGEATDKGIIVLNEQLLTVESSQTAYTSDANGSSVADEDIEVIMFHEQVHLLDFAQHSESGAYTAEQMGWQYEHSPVAHAQQNPWDQLNDTSLVFHGKQANPSAYGNVDHLEDTPESAAALFVGGDWSANLDEVRKQAIQQLYQYSHTGKVGPAFLQCTELDIARMAATGNKLDPGLPQGLTVHPIIDFKIQA